MYVTILLFVGFITIYYLWFKRKCSYWESIGVKQTSSGIFGILGETLSLITFRKSYGDYYRDVYLAHPNDPYVGMYEFTKPTFVVLNPEVAERITVKDFGHFVDRAPSRPEQPDQDPMQLGLVSLTGDKWRAVRQKLVPTFTAGKLKGMLKTMSICASGAAEELKDGQQDYDITRATGKYTVDVIGTCVFGIDPSEISAPDSKFRECSKNLVLVSSWQAIKVMLVSNVPWLGRMIKASFFRQESTDYFCGVVRETFDRGASTADTNNFVGLLKQLKSEGSVQVKSKDVTDEDDYLRIKDNTPPVKIELTDKLLFGQALQFLTAGVEAVSLTMTYLIHELSRDQDAQERLRNEIDSVFQESGEELTYDALKNMSFLHNCIMETQRMYPTAVNLVRVSVKDYHLKETGSTMKAGTKVIIPILAFHSDPRYFTDPEKFNPDRFETEKHPSCAFMPFGDGPRMCIGMRFALLKIKMGIVTLLRRYRFEPSLKTRLPLQFNKRDFLLSPMHPIYVNAIKI